MRQLLHSIFEISDQCRDVAVMYSTGCDSTVMLDLFARHAPKSIGKVIFMYFCPGLSYEERILTYYEKRYKIEITRMAHPDCAYLVNDRSHKRKVKMSGFEKVVRAEGAAWIAYGFRKDESLQRRGQLSLAPDGIDWKYLKLFPIGEWAARHTRAYVKQNKLLLPPEYKLGYRDLNVFKGDSLVYIYRNYPQDYERIVAMYPDTAGELMRAMEGIGVK